MVERSVHPETLLAGDPFAYAGDKPRGCFACYDGWVYLGFEREEDGELVEIVDPVPCGWCLPVSRGRGLKRSPSSESR